MAQLAGVPFFWLENLGSRCVYLSAGESPRNSLWLAPHAKEWEKFELIPGVTGSRLFNPHFKTYLLAEKIDGKWVAMSPISFPQD